MTQYNVLFNVTPEIIGDNVKITSLQIVVVIPSTVIPQIGSDMIVNVGFTMPPPTGTKVITQTLSESLIQRDVISGKGYITLVGELTVVGEVTSQDILNPYAQVYYIA